MLLQLCVVPVIVAVLLTKWGVSTVASGASAAARSCLAVLCRKRVVVTEAEAAALRAAAAAEAGAGAGADSPLASPRADEVASPIGRGGASPGGAGGGDGRPTLTAYKSS